MYTFWLINVSSETRCCHIIYMDRLNWLQNSIEYSGRMYNIYQTNLGC